MEMRKKGDENGWNFKRIEIRKKGDEKESR